MPNLDANQTGLLEKAKGFYPGHVGALGVLLFQSEAPIFIKSGIDGGPFGGTHRGGVPRLPGWAFTTGGASQGNIATHVEGHAVAIMWQRRMDRAMLLVDRPMCKVCDANLPNAMPPRSSLDVLTEVEGHTILRSSHWS
jgi:hypothetical protein